jgi:hypothetical protein
MANGGGLKQDRRVAGPGADNIGMHPHLRLADNDLRS